MSEPRFEKRYEDVLQNIEFGIIRVYREHPEMTDWDALDAVQALIRTYQAEVRGRQATPPVLHSLSQEAYDAVRTMCEWRLGRTEVVDKEGAPLDLAMQPVPLDEMVACLKRIRKSINFWRRNGGRQGYLTYVSHFIP